MTTPRRIRVKSAGARRVKLVDQPQSHVDPEMVAQALGAKRVGPSGVKDSLDLAFRSRPR